MKSPAESFPPPPFEGFADDALAFFSDLAEHQDRDWMAANKARYESVVRSPLLSLVAEVSDRLVEAGEALRGDPKRGVFRLNRDVRFSADKRPYKTNASAVFTRDGAKASPGLLYFHLAPESSFVAAGFFQPEPAELDALRAAMAGAPQGWLAVEAELHAHDLALSQEYTLKRAPRGYEAAPVEVAAALKLKSWIVRRDLSPASIRSPALVEALVDLALQASPLLRFGWSALARVARPAAF